MFLWNYLAEFIYYVIVWLRKRDIICFSLIFSIFAPLFSILLNVFYHYSMKKDSIANWSLWRFVCNSYDLPRRFSRVNFLFPVFFLSLHFIVPAFVVFWSLARLRHAVFMIGSIALHIFTNPVLLIRKQYTMLMSPSSPSCLSYFPAHMICQYLGLKPFGRIFIFLFSFRLCILQNTIDIVLIL